MNPGGPMAVIEADGLTYSYGRVTALRDLDLSVPEGAIYALLGPNGAGKTTLLQLLMGVRRPRGGRIAVMGRDAAALTARDRARIGYVAEGQGLPGWMRLDEVEAFLAPLYPNWDAALATELRRRFRLDAHRPMRTFSRGEQMKAALLCALAPRPKLLVMDEPFSGMDALVKDDLVRGLLDTARAEGSTVFVSSHDLAELELVADWVGLLDRGSLLVSEPIESLLTRLQRVEASGARISGAPWPAEWLGMEQSGDRVSVIVQHAPGDLAPGALTLRLPGARIEVRRPTLREAFVALARGSESASTMEAGV
ncbi:MAG: ABC transporter ATP-binding protein [Gemmatimonadota bacterium]|nr:ABC transporter ATP-binding protein [Gemmatimonadota bacterium]